MKYKKSNRVNSKKHLKELTSGKYFTFEYKEGRTFHYWGQMQLVAEEYRIPRKLREQLKDDMPFIQNAKKLLIFNGYTQAKKFIDYNISWNLPNNRYCWMPIIMAIATTDRILYHGHDLMKYWRDAKRAKNEEDKEFFALGEHWMYLYRYCEDIRQEFSSL